MKQEYACRVCGLLQPEKPWGDDGRSPNNWICECCGVEFGYEDETRDTVLSYRKWWKERGMSWFRPKAKPVDWDPEEQFKNIPPEFR